MKRRVRFLKIPKGTRVQGVFGGAVEYVREGDPVDGKNGGGFIGPMELVGNTLHIHKVDGEGKPYRNFGQVAGRASGGNNSMGADTRLVAITVDAVSISSLGFTVLYDEEPDAPVVKAPSAQASVDAGDSKLASAAERLGKTVEELQKEMDPPPVAVEPGSCPPQIHTQVAMDMHAEEMLKQQNDPPPAKPIQKPQQNQGNQNRR